MAWHGSACIARDIDMMPSDMMPCRAAAYRKDCLFYTIAIVEVSLFVLFILGLSVIIHTGSI